MIDTTYGAGGTSTATQSPGLNIGGDDLGFWREMARRSMDKMQQRPAEPMMGDGMSMRRPMSGGGAITRERVRSSGDTMRGAEGGHSFVTNIKGGPQVMGGVVRSSFGASPGNTFYGGWDPTGGADLGPTRFANLPDNSGAPAINPGMDPAARARMLNGGLPSASFMPLLGRQG